jgi:hypothetical protein
MRAARHAAIFDGDGFADGFITDIQQFCGGFDIKSQVWDLIRLPVTTPFRVHQFAAMAARWPVLKLRRLTFWLITIDAAGRVASAGTISRVAR